MSSSSKKVMPLMLIVAVTLTCGSLSRTSAQQSSDCTGQTAYTKEKCQSPWNNCNPNGCAAAENACPNDPDGQSYLLATNMLTFGVCNVTGNPENSCAECTIFYCADTSYWMDKVNGVCVNACNINGWLYCENCCRAPL